MRPYIILAIIGIIVAGLAALAVRSTVSTPEAQNTPAAQTTTRILIAKENIPTGTFIQADRHLTWGEWPADKVQSPPFVLAEGRNIGDYNGAVARRTIFAGEPISDGAMIKPGEGGFMSAVLLPGMRAVSVPVNATTGNAGFIFPGDHVDLILTHGVQGINSESFVSETFVEDVRVLAVDQLLDNPENKALLAKTVTLEVTPRQAEAVTVALEIGRISLALRSLSPGVETPEEESAPFEPAMTQAAEGGEMAAETPDMDYFYPPQTDDHAYTRDSDISKLLGNGGEGTMRVRVIRGDDTQELQFQQGAQ